MLHYFAQDELAACIGAMLSRSRDEEAASARPRRRSREAGETERAHTG
jgi:hypothetical protein